MKAEAKLGAELWERINALIASKPGEPIKESFIASKAGLTKNMYSVYKNRQSLLRSDTLYGIAQALSTSVEFLLTGREPGRITFDEAAFLSAAKPYRPVIQGLDALDAHARAVLSRAIIDLASPPQPTAPGGIDGLTNAVGRGRIEGAEHGDKINTPPTKLDKSG